MEKIIKEITVYNFNELSEDAKQKAVEDYSNEYTTQEANNEMFFEDIKESFKSEYNLNIDPHYSLSYCQGDGLSFDCENLLESKKLIEEIKSKLTTKEKTTFTKLMNKGYLYRLYIKNENHHYCFASGRDIGVDLDIPYYEKTTQLQDDVIDKTIDIVIDWYLKECKKWEQLGYDTIYYTPTFEEFEEIANDNGWLFLEDGGFYAC